MIVFFFGAVSYPHDLCSLSREEFVGSARFCRKQSKLNIVRIDAGASFSCTAGVLSLVTLKTFLPIERNNIYEIILVKANCCDLRIFFKILLRISLSLIFEFKNQKNGLKLVALFLEGFGNI